MMLKKIKTISKYIDLRWIRGMPLDYEFNGCNFIYIDNKFFDFFEQVESFFRNGFLNKQKTVIIIKFYFSNYYNVAEAAKKLGVRVVFYKFYRQVPKIDGKIVFYPYNGQSNCRMILNRKACHVFLTHGESNKKASVNRMVRMYDYVLASGDLSVQRYLASGIFTVNDIESGRVIRVGDMLISPFFDYLQENSNQPCIAYMPTWEGGLDEENYSSIKTAGVVASLMQIMQGMHTKKIIIKCHPNTGGRIISYKSELIKLVADLIDHGADVYLDPASSKFFDKYKKSFKKINADFENLKIVCGVVDVSASEFMLASKKIPTIVFVKKDKPLCASESYIKMRKHFMLEVGDKDGIDGAVNMINNEEGSNEFFNASFVTEEYLKNIKKADFSENIYSMFERSNLSFSNKN